MVDNTDNPIGIFDSGVGGMTVLRALLERLPGESYRFLGDTARLPYGTKGASTIIEYTLKAAGKLVDMGPVKMLVVACNTASSVALPALRNRFPHIPVVGVIKPGARAAVQASSSGHIVVLATEATVRGGAYVDAIHALKPEARIQSRACTLFVSLAEEGWLEGDVVEGVVRRYIGELFACEDKPDTLLLGCTHFPLLQKAIANVVGPDVAIVDSARHRVWQRKGKRAVCASWLQTMCAALPPQAGFSLAASWTRKTWSSWISSGHPSSVFPGLDVRNLVGAGFKKGLAHTQVLLLAGKALVVAAPHAGLGLQGSFQILERRIVELPKSPDFLARIRALPLAVAHSDVDVCSGRPSRAADFAYVLPLFHLVALFDKYLAKMRVGNGLAVCLRYLHSKACAAGHACEKDSAAFERAHWPAKVSAHVKAAVKAGAHGSVAQEGNRGSAPLPETGGDKAVYVRPKRHGLARVGARLGTILFLF